MRVRRRSRAHWAGSVEEGSGGVALASGAFDGPFSLRSRSQDTPHTNPEELIGAAEAGCFAMSLANLLTGDGHPPTRLDATATVTLESTGGGFSITSIELEVEGEAPGVDESRFAELAEEAKSTCPVSRALAGTTIGVRASLRT